MLAFFLKRLASLVFTMLVVSALVFAAFEFTPGQMATKILGPFSTQDQRDRLMEELGLHRPVWERYFEWLGNVLSGDLGYSTLYKLPVNDIIWDRLGNTLTLAAIAFAVMVPLSVLFGISAGMREGSKLDRTISVASIVTTSVPEFASGVFLASIFVIGLGWLPGTATLEAGARWPIAAQLVLPVTVIVLYDLGYVVRMVRASMVEVMTRPYIRTAILKGLTFRDVILKHALRNAMIAPFTVILLQINYMITGVVVVEAVFAYPGFGRMLLDSALSQDVATVQAASLFAVLVSVSTQIAGDLGYMMLNPRIRFS
ncbi:ABC transporter permease [Dongia deserti]|uniref:ABC transporter permease n=1 Tax=Dongia deserti TaxID=2268030 RepID=UPI000E65BACA|nr:ABC transporter permease [Dongia deserti]